MSTPNYNQHGNPDYIMNLPDGVLTLIPGMAVTKLAPKFTPEFMETAGGGVGQVEAVAECVDQMIEYTGSGFLLDEADFRAAPAFTNAGRYHIFQTRGAAYEGGKFQLCDFTTKSWAKVAAAA